MMIRKFMFPEETPAPILSRVEALRELKELGINPYPAVNIEKSGDIAQIKENFEKWEGKRVILAGRITARRIMGKTTFMDLMDESGKMQLYINRDVLCPTEDKFLYNRFVKKLLDIGDFISVEGEAFRTKTGEPSVKVEKIILLAKALRPVPLGKEKEGQKFSALRDPELRYRQRYLDLLVNKEVRELFKTRTRIINAIRQYLDSHGYLEVETPILHTVYGGAHARPFVTHLNALDLTLYLRIADELHLKRLLIGGYEGVYEFSRDFRNEGIDRTHNPEFTMLELYVAYKDYYWMADFTEAMIRNVAQQALGTTQVTYGEHTIDFGKQWHRIRFLEALKEETGKDVRNLSDSQLLELAEKVGVENPEKLPGRFKIIEKIFGKIVEPQLLQPTFVFDFPIEMSPLAKRHREDPTLTERFEVIVAGFELCNAYTELNDPYDQRQRFEWQRKAKAEGDEEAMPYDEDFIVAMEYGMPPMAGLGVGIDRLVMLLTNQHAIQEVILFPLMRPKPVEEYAPSIPYHLLEEPTDAKDAK